MNATQPASVIIPTIVDDNLLELDEIFQVEIGLQNSEDRNCIILQPNVVDITIMDDDCESCKSNDQQQCCHFLLLLCT